MRTSPVLRLVIMGVLLLVLNVPLTMMCGVVSERTARRDAVAAEVSRNWGDSQIVSGPILTVPYRSTWADANGVQRQNGYYTFLPETVEIVGTLEPGVRKRTIFSVIVYTAHLKLRGSFGRTVPPETQNVTTEVLWNQAVVNLGLTDPRGLARALTITWNGQAERFLPGTQLSAFNSGMHAPAPGLTADRKEPIRFEMDLELRGTKELKFVPTGSDTTVQLSSSWPHPGFVGTPPDTPNIGDQGFAATWRVPYFGLGYTQSAKSDDALVGQVLTQANASAFGVALVQPVDIYVQTDRATKYAVLFIVMTFVVAFLWEVTGSALVHPIQYLFVGFAMCLFYLLLLSIAEHRGFDVAYGIAASATTLLLAWYWTWVLGGRRQGVMMGGVLTLLYGYLYLLLRLEDYALLAGSCGLFAMLALVMFLTRRVNWYELRLGARASEGVK
jgi:inner membrane protein